MNLAVTKKSSRVHQRLDLVVVTCLMLLTAAIALRDGKFADPPAEDAAMLIRYASHLMQGHGIVWNVGEKPVDGATDFLPMVLIAGISRTGIHVELAARYLALASHFLTVLLLYVAMRMITHASVLPAALSAAYLAGGPGMGYVNAGFTTPVFALAVCVTWCLALCLTEHGRSGDPSRGSWLPLAFALSALVSGLIRPEGVLLSGFILIAITYRKGWKHSIPVVIAFFGIFLVLGGTYFLWRWRYFGHPLPNPFYKKGGGHLYMDGLLHSAYSVTVLSFPFLPAYVLGFSSQRTAEKAIFAMIPIAGFTAIWVLISDEMEYLMRFQYPILPIVLISWPMLLQGVSDSASVHWTSPLSYRNRCVLGTVLAFAAAILLLYGHLWKTRQGSSDGRYAVAKVLARYRHSDYVIASSEAGILPLYSGWRAIDTWGLNDSWIAQHGNVTDAYLDAYRPQVIMFHHRCLGTSADPLALQWDSMIEELQRYANTHHYTLAAIYGEMPEDTHRYYVRSDFPDSKNVIDGIRKVHYTWYTGTTAVDYAPLLLSRRSHQDHRGHRSRRGMKAGRPNGRLATTSASSIP